MLHTTTLPFVIPHTLAANTIAVDDIGDNELMILHSLWFV